MERRTRTFGDTMRQVERWFGRFSYPLVFLAPNNVICLFAGAAGMSVAGFFITNLAGTAFRLYLIRRVGETFESPIDNLLELLTEYRIPLLILSVALVAATSLFRSEEHTSELQSLMRISYAVFCLKKKKKTTTWYRHYTAS